RSSFGVASRRAQWRTLKLRQWCTTLAAVGDAMAVVAQLSGEFCACAFCRLRLPHRVGIVDAGRDDRDADDAVQAFIEDGADDDVGVLVRLFSDASSSFVDLK